MVKKLEQVTQKAVNFLAFSKEKTEIFVCTNDILLVGLKTGSILREFRGHTSKINEI